MSVILSSSQKSSVSRISGLILINAMLFQEVLADHDSRVYSLQRMLSQKNILNEFSKHWQFIIDNINYFPIFNIARKIINNLTSNKDTVDAVINLAETAQRVVSMRAALRHDLMGRVYHRLLAEAKYLGTYYTTIPAAIMLLKLALYHENWKSIWNDLDQISNMRVVDLSCGTGTLLMASADAITDNYIHACAEKGSSLDLASLHRVIVEKVIYGYDVLPSALHLTASTLALKAPEVNFDKMNLFSLPLGGQDIQLGSIEFLENSHLQQVMSFMPPSEKISGKKAKKIQIDEASLPPIDLCVMNPPFTRSVGGNLLFGSMPEGERKQMQEKLKNLVKRKEALANITAGLGSVFVAVADPYIKKNGRIALVLPKAVLSGIAWEATRELIRRKYRLDYIVASHDPLKWNFSENTDLSEVLLVATKVNNNSLKENEPKYVTAINLWRNPNTAFESLAVTNSLIMDNPPDITNGQGAMEVSIGKEKIAEAISYPWEDLKNQFSWMIPCSFAQSDLIRVINKIIKGNIWIPGQGDVGQINLCHLGKLGELGPDVRDIHDGFRLSKATTAYPAFLGHKSELVFNLSQKQNSHLSPLQRAKKGRSLRKSEDLWPLAGRILIAERLRFNTQRLVSIRLNQPVLSNVWWPFSLKEEYGSDKHDEYENLLVLWMNSTLGLLLFLAHRLETEGSWMKFKKPMLSMLPVLDPRTLSSSQLRTLNTVYDELCNETLLPFPEMNIDPVRAKIDKSIAQVLELPDFSILRNLLSQEPVVCLRRL